MMIPPHAYFSLFLSFYNIKMEQNSKKGQKNGKFLQFFLFYIRAIKKEAHPAACFCPDMLLLLGFDLYRYNAVLYFYKSFL